MHRCGVIRHIDKDRNIVRIGDDKSKKSFNAIYKDNLLDGFKKGDNIRYIFIYDKDEHQFPIEIISVDLNPCKPNPVKQVWIHDAFAEMSRRVTAKRKEKR